VDNETVLADISGMLCAILGVVDGLDLNITENTTFFDDLGMASIDLAALGGRLHSHYGRSINFAKFVAELDVNAIGQLRVGDLVEHIVSSNAGKAARR
jgi:acyl carrier protein